PNPPFDPFIVLVGTDARSLRALTHELVHDLSAWYMPIQPAWYAEGLATFLETASYDRKSGLFEAGRPSPDHAWSSSKPFLAAVLLDDQFSETTPNLGAFEARARLLVDFLVNVHPREFDRLCAALEATKSTAEAWARALPDLPIDRLDQALDDYASRGQYLILRRALTIPAPEIKVREMPDAEVHVVRAQLLRTPTPGVRPDDEGARRELEEATAADPTNTGAFARRVVWYTPPRQRPQLAAAAQRLADAHPTDWLAWLLVGLTTTGAQHRTALVRALAIDPNQPAVLSDLAAIDLREGRFEDALAFATRGMSFRQNVWPLAFEAMQAQLALGHCEDAALLARVLSTRGPRTFRTLVLRVAAASACKPRGAEETPDRAPPHPGPP
ncbi:MAG TPA: hypothetical protein VHO06_06530, partial [Polyangia bacterium]|nr:hypothetical protein [Polyangia bacterium]